MTHRRPLRTLAALTLAVGGAVAIPVTTAGVARADGCDGVAYSPPFSTSYGAAGYCGCSKAGYPGYREGYAFTVQGNAGGPIAIQLLGYDQSGHEQ
ncbi:MAG: hypothetical protein QOG45_1886, partial [Chloroflexota bacterium]|nr:hypothetical protein [Chloroflexota bacterium]